MHALKFANAVLYGTNVFINLMFDTTMSSLYGQELDTASVLL